MRSVSYHTSSLPLVTILNCVIKQKALLIMDSLKSLCAALHELLYLLYLQEHSSENILGGKYCLMFAVVSEQTKQPTFIEYHNYFCWVFFKSNMNHQEN